MKVRLNEKFPRAWKLGNDLYMNFRRHKISYTSGQVAFFFILSLFPFLIFTNALIASLNIPSDVAIAFLEPFFPEKIISYVTGYLDYINTQSGAPLLSFGIVVALFSSSKSVRALAYAFNLAYGTAEKRPFLLQVLFSMLFIFLSSIIFIICIVAVAFGNDFLLNVISKMTLKFKFIDIISLWRWVTMGSILFLILTLVYKFLPSAKIRFPETLPGTLFSLFGFLLLTVGFSFYVNHIVSASLIYGSVGAIVLLMLWMYFAGMILILGAEINKLFSDLKMD